MDEKPTTTENAIKLAMLIMFLVFVFGIVPCILNERILTKITESQQSIEMMISDVCGNGIYNLTNE